MKYVKTFSTITILLASVSTSFATEFTYVLTGGVSVMAYENAAQYMIIDASSTLNIDDKGGISGEGTLTYIYMRACEWEAPVPVDEFNCRIEGVLDGAFSISGEVLETIHRHDDENPLKDAIFEYADARASERPDYAPYRLSITLTPTGNLREKLVFWGLSSGKIERRRTGAATLGVFSSGLFDTPIELIALNAESSVSVPNNGHIYQSTGLYDAGTPVRGTGQIALTSLARDWLPSRTAFHVYLSSWVEGPDNRKLEPFELDAIADYAENGVDDTRAEVANDIIDSMFDLVDVGAIPPILDYAVMDIIREFRGLPPMSGR